MTREEYKRAKRRWIIQPIAVIVVAIVLIWVADAIGCALAP